MDLLDGVMRATLGLPNPAAPPVADLGARAASATPNNSRNNPGNIEDGPFARNQPGYSGADPNNPRFARFDSADAGNRAHVQLLKSSPNYRDKSVADIIQTYSPLGDNSESSVRNYIGYVSQRIGLDPNKPVPSDRVAQLAGAMREFETGKKVNSNFTPYAGTLKALKMASGPGNGLVPAGDYEKWLKDTLPPEVSASSGVTLPGNSADVIFQQAPGQIQDRQAGVETSLSDMGKRIDVLDQAQQAAQANQITEKTAQVQDAGRINNEILAGTDELKRQVQPVMEARDRVANQLDKLATMNPLERSLKSIFDLNYDQGYLTKQMETFDTTLKARMYDYQYLDTLQNTALAALDRRYGIDTALSDLNVQQSTEDLALVNQRLGLASQLLSSTKGSLETQSQLIVAQAQARDDVLSRIDQPTTVQLMNQAQQNGGQVDFNGVKFSYGELRGAAEKGDQQDRMVRSQQIALAQGEMNLADGIGQDLVKSMTRPQLEEAAANGGVWHGVQLPQDALTAGLAGMRDRAAGQAQDILMKMPATIATQTGIDTLNSMTSLYYRSKAMLSPGDLKASATQLRNGSQMIMELDQAVKSGADPEVIQGMIAKMGQYSKQYQDTVGNSILRSVGGDKRAAGYVQSFVYGSPMNAGTSAEALTYFALKGGLPQGLAVSPEARQVFIRATQIADEVRKSDPKAPFDRIQRAVQDQVGDYAASIIGTPRLNDAMSSLPAQARALNNPFGHIKDDWWRKTYADAGNAAAADLANQLKTSPNNIINMMNTMKPLGTDKASTDLFKAFMGKAGQFNSLEQQYLLEKLDSGNPIVAGKSNSELMEEFLFSPEFSQRINQTSQRIEGNSFGDYLVGPLAQGATQSAVMQYAGGVRDQASAVRVGAQTAARNANRVWGGSGTVRVMTVLASIPQIGTAGADKLRPFVNQIAGNITTPIAAIGSPRPGQMEQAQQTQGQYAEQQVLEALQRTKFKDPVMEQLRKAALENWQQYSSVGDSIMLNLSNESRRQ